MSKNPSNLPQHLGNKNSQAVATVSEHFSGPLPHPNILERYNEIVPGAAERILQSFEKQTKHRQDIERGVIRTDNFKSILGLVFGFIIAMSAILGGVYTALKSHPFLGGTLSFAGLALIIGAFVSNRYFPSKNMSISIKESEE